MKINELAKLYNLTPHTIRYYEKIGLLKPKYLENGYREYTYEHIQLLNTIRDLRFFDVPLSKIQDYITTKNVNKTLEILEFEINSLQTTIAEAKKKKKFLKERVDLINFALEIPNAQIQIVNHQQRIIITGENKYANEEQFYYELKSLHSMHNVLLNSSNQNLFGAIIYEEQKQYSYQAFYFTNEKLKKTNKYFKIIPSGKYLTYSYSGKYIPTKELLEVLNKHITNYSLKTVGPFYEIYLIDFHETNNAEEFITQFEIRVE